MGFKELREFQINIYSLTNKLHDFEFEITNKLFESKEFSLISKGNGVCKLSLQKSETLMNLHFDIKAEVELVCDRSLDTFMFPISVEEDIIIKFGDDETTLSEDVFVIRRDASSVNVGDFIYEFVSLAVPMRKIHPRFEGEDQPDLIYTSQDDNTAEDDSEPVDPRWEALKKLKE
jgi:uncharacterized protein